MNINSKSAADYIFQGTLFTLVIVEDKLQRFGYLRLPNAVVVDSNRLNTKELHLEKEKWHWEVH